MGERPRRTGERKEGPGGPKNTGRKWPPPSFLVRDSAMGGEIEKGG